MSQLIDGKAVAKAIREEVAAEVAKLKEQGSVPCLAVILVGEDPASCVYVRNKHKACEEVGITSLEIRLPEDTAEEELLAEIARLNADPKVNGILVQLPLPKHISEKAVIKAISTVKDVDAFHPENVGAMVAGDPVFLPCTPAGIIELLDRYGVEIAGKECVVIGRSNIVGKPVAHLLLSRNGTVTVCHSKTADLASVTRRADILVVAIGRAKFVTADMVKEGAAVIDVGMDRDEDGKLCGDVDFASVAEKAGYLTPVPGGVGPMTIAELMKNTLRAYRLQNR